MTKQNKTTTKKTAPKKAATKTAKTTVKATSAVASKKDIEKTAVKMCMPEKKALDEAKSHISALITGEDLRTAILIVSVVINLFFLIAWVTLQVTDAYDGEVASFLFSRTLIR